MLHTISYLRTMLAARKGEDGASAVEYGLMVAGIAVAIIITVFLLGDTLNSLFSSVEGSLAGA